MKKKILFICSNMNIGGFQKSLIALLRYFDYEKYDVDLLLLSQSGIFTDEIPSEVRLLPLVLPEEYFYDAVSAIHALLHSCRFSLAIRRALAGAVMYFDKGRGAQILARGIPALHSEYDVAIDYNGQHILYYLVERIKASRKISYFHTDYSKWRYYERTDRSYYKKVDAIVTVSDECVASMKEIFPEFQDKIYRVENIIAERTVQTNTDTATYQDNFDGIRLLTVGRVCLDKGIDFAVEACEILSGRGLNFRWYWVGPYDAEDAQVKRLEEMEIGRHMVLLGPAKNPYRYMKDADLLIHPSRFEGKAVAVEEAKVLHLPVIATAYSTVRNQLEDGKNGRIVEMNAQALADAIEDCILHPEKIAEMREWMKANCKGNEDEIQRLYRLIEG